MAHYRRLTLISLSALVLVVISFIYLSDSKANPADLNCRSAYPTLAGSEVYPYPLPSPYCGFLPLVMR